jgi:uncharacterized protein (TIGR03083 family)
MTAHGTPLGTRGFLAAIEEHSHGLAKAAGGNLDAPVKHCPGWSVADLVWHVTQVHWFWATIAEERLSSPPDESRRPGRPADDKLVDAFEDGARRLVEVLREADQDAECWTWAPGQHNIAFITRHQVQEAVVHHWDAANATGGRLQIAPDVAADAVEEFLTFSVSSDTDPATASDDKPLPLPLNATFRLAATDVDRAWSITDGSAPSTLAHETGSSAGDNDVPAITGTVSDLLLWLYQRVDLPLGDVRPEAVERFRGLCFTD